MYDSPAEVVAEDDGSVVLEVVVVGNGEGLGTVRCMSARQRSSSWFWSMERSGRLFELESEAGISAVDLSL